VELFDYELKGAIMRVHILLVVISTLGPALGYDLCTCNQLTCPTPENCSHGTALDQCGCCPVCARGVNEPCGAGAQGPGVCASGLQCVFDARPGDLVTGNEHGTCRGRITGAFLSSALPLTYV